ncbi:MAG: DUF4956 domain-containing protein [Gemmataceae bacterium]|nr:DUF4956 domain-containing protein [Gemmataceae bacterium]
MFDFLDVVVGDQALSLQTVVHRLGMAFALGCLVGAIHHVTCRRLRGEEQRSFLATLVLLSLFVSLVTVVIGNNTARAFSLVGTLAIVRFRTVVEDTRDTAFVIYAVIAGMSAGTGFVIGPLLCAPLVLIVGWVLRSRFHDSGSTSGLLVVRLAIGAGHETRVEGVLQKHLPQFRVAGLATAKGGSAIDVTYAVRLPSAERIFALLTELNRTEGVQSAELKED